MRATRISSNSIGNITWTFGVPFAAIPVVTATAVDTASPVIVVITSITTAQVSFKTFTTSNALAPNVPVHMTAAPVLV